jgi:hypothetical protein
MLDTSQLARTSSKRGLRWRDPALTFIWLREGDPIVAAHKIEDKRAALSSCAAEDRILAVRQVRYPLRVEVMVIDDLSEARRALAE